MAKKEQSRAEYVKLAGPTIGGQSNSQSKTLTRQQLRSVAVRPENKNNDVSLTDRITDMESMQKMILEKMEENDQNSAAFDYYHQMTPNSVSPNVLEQLYGRDLFFLRQYYQVNSPIDQLIFLKRYEQLKAVSECVADNPKKVGWHVVHKQHDSPNFKVTKETEKWCRFFEELIQNPNKIRHPGGFPDALIAMAESKMLFDRLPIEKLGHKGYYGNMPASYLIPDAATIKPTTWVLNTMSGSKGYSGKTRESQAHSMAIDSQHTMNQLMGSSSYGFNYGNEQAIKSAAKQLSKKSGDPEMYEAARLRENVIVWVQQMPDKQLAAGYTNDDLRVFISNPSTQVNTWGWSSGSAFERSFAFGEVIYRMMGYNQEIFDSKMPEAILAMPNSGVDKRGKQQLHERMSDEGADRYSNLLVEFVNDPEKDIKIHKIKDKPTDMQFKDMFILYIKLKCAPYGLDYTELNLEDGKSGGMQGAGAQTKRMDAHAATGVQSDTRYYAHCYTEALILPWSKDYKMEFVHDVTETEDQVKLKKEKMAYTSVQETRIEDNQEEEWWKDAPKEFQEELKGYSKYFYMPGLDGAQKTQLIMKDKELAAQKEMNEQAEAEGEEQPGKPEEPKEDEEITNLKSAIGQQEAENKEIEAGMEKSFAVSVEHHYVS